MSSAGPRDGLVRFSWSRHQRVMLDRLIPFIIALIILYGSNHQTSTAKSLDAAAFGAYVGTVGRQNITTSRIAGSEDCYGLEQG